jgi:hypothetical protein
MRFEASSNRAISRARSRPARYGYFRKLDTQAHKPPYNCRTLFHQPVIEILFILTIIYSAPLAYQ